MSESKTPPDAVRVVERMLVDGFAGGNTRVVDELCAPDIVEHQFGLAGRGEAALAKIRKGMTDVHAGFPDLRFTLADWAVNGDLVWLRAEGTATNTGPFMGPPTGLPVEFTVIDVARVQGGRIVEHWGVPDRFAILLRLGRIAPPVAPDDDSVVP